jgi:aminopeptidase N
MSRILLAISLFVGLILQSHAQSLYQNPEANKCRHASTKIATRASSHSARSGAENSYDVKFYFLDIEASDGSSYIKGNVSMKAQAVSAMTQVILELSDAHQIDSVFIDDIKIANYTHNDALVTITLPAEISAGDFFTSKVYYQGDGSTQGFFSGISTGGGYTWTLSEPTNARDWFPCKQVLEDKADSAYIYITVASHLKAGSNGLLTNITELEDSRLRFEWKTYYPIAYYLISMAVGPYEEYTTTALVEGQEVPVQSYIYPGTLAAQQASLDLVGEMVERESELFGPYPFANEKYGHCQAPMGGGMEHQTMSTMTNFGFTLSAHELGHQWFGDNVTCSSWQDIWVNEGFARYAEYLMLEQLKSKNEADDYDQSWINSVVSLTGGSVYVPLTEVSYVNRVFDLRLTYNKGAVIIHMIRKLVDDDDVFFDILRTYQDQYKNGVASGEDFKGVVENKSGQDFDNFFDEWYYGEGYPTFTVKWNFDSDTLYIQQKQKASTTVTPFFHIPVDYKIGFSDGTYDTLRLLATSTDELFKFDMDKEVKSLAFDPEGWVLKKVSGVAHSTALKYTPPPVTGIEQRASAEFSVYPNPSSNQLTIHSDNDVQPLTVQVLTMHGNIVYSGKGERAINVSTIDFPPGIYIVEIGHKHGVSKKKIEILR